MKTGDLAARHLDDAEIVRLIDGEAAGQEQRRWRDHLSACARCQEEVAAMRAHSRTISEWLDRADLQPDEERATPMAEAEGTSARRLEARRRLPARRSHLTAGPWLKAAAIILLMAAPVMAIPGAREWVAQRIGTGTANVAQAETTLATPGEDDDAVLIRFQPAEGAFLLSISTIQAEGMVTISRTSADGEAVLEVGTGRDRPQTVVSGRGIQIENQVTSTASYALALPRGVSHVLLVLGEHRLELGHDDIDGHFVLSLDRVPHDLPGAPGH